MTVGNGGDLLYVSVIGGGECDAEACDAAYEVGRLLGAAGHVVVCGGLGGVMDAAARGARDAGGVSIGILPGPDRASASPALTYSFPTDMGHARNTLVARAGDAVIAVGGGYGTLSEIALALKMGKPVVCLKSWDVNEVSPAPAVEVASTPGEAVEIAIGAADR